MPQLLLEREELSKVLSRAQEIAAREADGAPLEDRFAAYLQATDELGLPRDAVIQALKEQLSIEDVDTQVGARVFALSADGFHYTAVVVGVEGPKVRVRFDVGGEQLCDMSSLRAFSLAPGTIVNGCWKGDDGWYSARIRQYDAEKGEVTLVYRTDGVVETLPLTRLRLPVPARKSEKSSLQWAASPLLDLALKLGAGAGFGFLITRLLGL